MAARKAIAKISIDTLAFARSQAAGWRELMGSQLEFMRIRGAAGLAASAIKRWDDHEDPERDLTEAMQILAEVAYRPCSDDPETAYSMDSAKCAALGALEALRPHFPERATVNTKLHELMRSVDEASKTKQLN